MDRVALVRACVASVVVIAIAACSGNGDESKHKSAPEPDPLSEWAIHIFDGNGSRVDLGPVKEISFPQESGPLQAKAPGQKIDKPSQLLGADAPKPGGAAPAPSDNGLGPKSAPMATIDTPEGRTEIEQDLATQTGWALVYGAAYQCGFRGAGAAPWTAGTPTVPPWSYAVDGFHWSIFPHFEISGGPPAPDSCDRELAYTEALVCVANELANVADAVAPIHWTNIPTTSQSGMPPGPWTIPVQSNKDRFIARDLAIYMLATVALNDTTIVNLPTNTLSCAAAYAHSVELPSWGTQNASWLFDPSGGSAQYFPPFDPAKRTIVDANIPGLATARLETQTQLLRTAGRLLNELIDKSVAADLAGTAKRRARATDYRRGSETAWGIRNNENGKYNTLAHAVRVIAGRWELSPTNLGSLAPFYTTDPKCGHAAAADLLDEKYGPDFSARVNAEGIRTDGQRVATQVVEGAGIVVPHDAVVSQGIGPVREAIANQLKETASQANGFPATAATGVASSVGYALADVSDADLVFALNRTFNQYRLLTASIEKLPTLATPGAGLKAAAYITPDLTTVGGVALADGMPKQDLAADVMSRVAGIQDASQCDEFGGAVGQLLADYSFRNSFQDSYSIGQALMRRLVVLRESVDPVSGLEGVHLQAQAASSEGRAWTGPGKIVATSLPAADGSGLPGSIWIFTLGFTLEDFAATATTAGAIGQQLVLAYGPPWVADCAAGLRTNCPAGFENDYLAQAVLGNVAVPSAADKLAYGYDGTVGTFAFPGQNGPKFNPTYVPDGATEENHLYVILAHDPKNPAAGGKVLGSVVLHHPLEEGGLLIGGTAIAVSEKQRKHFNDILGIGTSYRDQVGVGTRTLSEGPAYCLGIPKEPFVPLENELTSDSDQYENSWKHYLTLARQAAAKADDLGQKLVELGLQKDFRREAANEELAQICGDFTSVDKLDVSDGQVKLKPPEDDDNLKSCLDEETYDVVFLTDDPTPLIGQQEVKGKLGCNSQGPNPNPECIGILSTAGLNLAKYEPAPPGQVAAKCSGITDLVPSLKTGFKGQLLKEHGTDEWLQPTTLKLLAGGLRMEVKHVVDPTGPDRDEWAVFVSGQARMSSQPGSKLWPGCRYPNAPACDEPNEAALYDSLFRRVLNSTTLGQSQDLDSADLELYRIMWRVQGALWTIAALSGTVPEQMFDIRVPAADFNGAWQGPKRAPVFTVFGTGQFVNGQLQGVADQDREFLGPADPVGADFELPFNEAPPWLVALYDAGAEPYLHVSGVNPEIAGFGPSNLGNWIKQQSERFDLMKCEAASVVALTGDPVGGVSGPQTDATDAVVSLRKGKSWGKLCKNANGNAFLTLATDSSGEVVSSFADLLVLWDSGGISSSFLTIPKLIPPTFPLEAPDSSVPQYHDFAALADTQGSLGGGYAYVAPMCQHPRLRQGVEVGPGVAGMHFIEEACVLPGSEKFGTMGFGFPQACTSALGGPCLNTEVQYSRRMLLPLSCSAGDRVQAFVNSYPPLGSCNAAAQLAQAATLACAYSLGGLTTVSDQRPKIKKVEDLAGFVLWIDGLSVKSKREISDLYLEKLPKRIVDQFSQEKVSTDGLKGEHGQQLLELRKALETLKGGWDRVSGDLEQLRDGVDGVRLEIKAAKIKNDTALANLAIQRMGIHASMIDAAAGVIGAFSVGNLGGAIASKLISSESSLAFGAAMLSKTKDIEDLAKQEKDNNVAQALLQLHMTSGPLYTDLKGALSDIRISAATVLQIVEQIRFGQEKAKYEAAKAMGADYVLDADGKPVKLPVNTVQRRLYDATRIRYEAALKDAKYLAYIARIAIEQRIGARLSTITTDVGPLQEPYLWVDDVCDLTGVDYSKLRSFDIPDGGTPETDGGVDAVAQEYADSFIGDYVDKLANFVEYYNIAYPSHDGDDTGVLSLRDDLLGGTASCVADSPNLLLYSGDLTGYDFVTEGNTEKLRGWELFACAAWNESCLRVEPSAALVAQATLPEVAPNGGYAWLHDDTGITPATPADPDAGVPVPEGGVPETGTPTLAEGPDPRTVSQVVELPPGATYVLSWWDQARDEAGAYPAQDAPPYRASVTAPDGQQVAYFSDTPFRPSSATALDQWSPRRSIEFKAVQGGEYRVSFGASADGTQVGSVLIANIQLEQAAPGALPSAYVHNVSTRQHVAVGCGGLTKEDVQKAFVYGCDQNQQCYYELAAPVVIDTTGLAKGESRLNGKLAAGNYNFRHITVAVNFVGTAVKDCQNTGSSSCYGSGYLEYSLDHDAFQAKVIPWDGIPQVFNFGSGSINHGKGLAAERYITLPMGSADSALLSQLGMRKPELRGRPLDGSYRFRIWDSPDLVWSRLEDVQFILEYRYWSKIDPQGTAE